MSSEGLHITPKGTYVCGPRSPYHPNVRLRLGEDKVAVYAWPSRGGVIILDDAEAIDLEFLGLDPLNPPLERLREQDGEDAFSQSLLCLGAKWWDSEERHFFVSEEKAASGGYDAAGHRDGSFMDVERPDPTTREKRWVKVGWPSTGGLWISEFDQTWGGVEDENDLPPRGERFARVKMARSMDERCKILEDRFRGRFLKDMSDYEGHAFLRAWDWKKTGEVGPLLTPEETFNRWRDSLNSGKRLSHENENAGGNERTVPDDQEGASWWLRIAQSVVGKTSTTSSQPAVPSAAQTV